jgi:hypothetical protein
MIEMHFHMNRGGAVLTGAFKGAPKLREIEGGRGGNFWSNWCPKVSWVREGGRVLIGWLK